MQGSDKDLGSSKVWKKSVWESCLKRVNPNPKPQQTDNAWKLSSVQATGTAVHAPFMALREWPFDEKASFGRTLAVEP